MLGVRLVFEDEALLKELGYDHYHSMDGSEHGRLEERSYRAVVCPQILKDQHDWPYLTSLVEVTSRREIKDQVSEEIRYYITF